MSKPDQERLRLYAQARVDDAGGVDAAKPDDFTQKSWRDLCSHLGVASPRRKKVRSLDEALRAVAELAKP